MPGIADFFNRPYTLAGANVSKYRIVKYGAAVDTAEAASAPADKLLGVTPRDVTTGDIFPVVRLGEAYVECGGAVAAGDELTTDAAGKAVVGAAGNKVIGTANEAGTDGKVISFFCSLGTV